jgi:DNA polymerase III delta subunit
MLTVFVGTTRDRATAAQKIIAAEMKDGNQLAAFSDAAFKKESVMAYVGGADMFGSKYVVHLSRVSESADGLEFFIHEAGALAESETVYVVEENELSKEFKKVFEDAGAKVTEFKEAKPNFFGGLTAFNLVDAYNVRDKKNSWMLFTKLIAAGTSAEEIAGAMIWNFKNVALYFSMPRPTAEALGMKPFVFSKVATAAKNFSQQEIATKSFELSSALHRSHRGEGDGATLLELFILKSL